MIKVGDIFVTQFSDYNYSTRGLHKFYIIADISFYNTFRIKPVDLFGNICKEYYTIIKHKNRFCLDEEKHLCHKDFRILSQKEIKEEKLKLIII